LKSIADILRIQQIEPLCRSWPCRWC